MDVARLLHPMPLEKLNPNRQQMFQQPRFPRKGGFFWDLFASLHLLCCLSSEEMGLALSLVQSALPWTLVRLKGLRLELFSCLGQSCGQEEGWKPAPVPSTCKSPLSQSSSRALPNGRASHSSSKSPPVKHVPLLGG